MIFPPRFPARRLLELVALESATLVKMEQEGARRQKGSYPTYRHGASGDEETSDKGVWLWLAVSEVDELHQHCLAAGIEVTVPPTDCPWGSQELHLRHPYGHAFRLACGTNDAD
jgi:uncharacterized glyoxalase superfamily protein PhnB